MLRTTNRPRFSGARSIQPGDRKAYFMRKAEAFQQQIIGLDKTIKHQNDHLAAEMAKRPGSATERRLREIIANLQTDRSKAIAGMTNALFHAGR